MLDLNEIQRHEKKNDAERAIQEQRQDVGERKWAGAERIGRQHRTPRPPLDDHEQRQRDYSEDQRGDHHWRCGPERRPLEQPEHEASQTQDGECSADPIAARQPGRIAALGHESQRQDDDRGRQWHVHKEDGAPADVFHEPTAGHRSDGRRNRAECRPGADGSAPLGLVKRGADDGEAAWDEERRADSLQSTAHDERARRRRGSTQNRSEREKEDAEEEHALPAKLIAQRAADQDQGAREQRVSFDHPLDVGDRRMKVRLQCGQRDVDDRPVDERHARCEDRCGQRPALRRRHASL